MYSSSNFENDFKQSEYVPARTKRLTKKKVKEDRLTGPQLYIIITQITEIFQYFGNILKSLHENFELLENKVNQLTDIIDDYSSKYAVLPILENSREIEEQQFDGSNDNSQNSSSSKSVLKSNKVHIDDDMNTSTEIVEKSLDESMLTDRDANLAVEQKLYNSFPAPLHIERVSTATSFCCPICRKCFSSKKSLKRHIENVHVKENRFVCAKCGMAFVDIATRKRHYLVHSGKKPFKCSYCFKAFTRAANLKRHLRKHLIQRQYGNIQLLKDELKK